MAGFCVSCGNPLAAGARFCNKCGATQPGAPAPVGTVMPPAPVSPAPQGSSPVLKIILGILAFFVFLMLIAAGSCIYIGYRVKQRAHEFSQSMGGNVKPYTGRRQPCAMLSTSEASDAMGQTVSSVEQRGTSVCEYTYGANGQHFDVEYTWQGGAITMGMAHGALKHISGMETFTQLDGIGDEAYLAPGNSALMMRKGDVMVNIDLRESGVTADAAKKMAGKIAGHL
jgi:zinc-ribbon domain